MPQNKISGYDFGMIPVWFQIIALEEGSGMIESVQQIAFAMARITYAAYAADAHWKKSDADYRETWMRDAKTPLRTPWGEFSTWTTVRLLKPLQFSDDFNTEIAWNCQVQLGRLDMRLGFNPSALLNPALLHILCSSTWTLATIERSFFHPIVPSRSKALGILRPCGNFAKAASVYDIFCTKKSSVSSIQLSHRKFMVELLCLEKIWKNSRFDTSTVTRPSPWMDWGALVLSNQRWDAAEWVGYRHCTEKPKKHQAQLLETV